MTIPLDQGVLDWYRDLGTGYQVRINLVLRAYMEAIIAMHIESPGDRDWLMNPL